MATRGDGSQAPALSRPAFVGRERALAALGRALAAPAAVVLVEGEAGIGKSRLLEEFLASPDGQARLALVASCPPYRVPYTLSAVVDAVRQAADRPAGLRLSGLAGALRPLFPEWAAELPPTPDPAVDATAARHRLFRALAELLARLQVGLLVAEDVHWADEATLEFLLFLATRRPQQMSLLITYRPEDVPDESVLLRLSSRLAGGAAGLRLSLSPLGEPETAALVSSMLAGERVSDELAAFVHDRTEGLPLAVEESLRLLRDLAALDRRGGQWAHRPQPAFSVPVTIRDTVLERAGRLSRDAQAVLRAAAVLADPAGEPTVLAVAALPPGRAQEGLTETLRSRLLAEDGRRRVSFRHALACSAVYEAIQAPERGVLHGRAGQVLEGASPTPVPQLARHFREAGDTARWCRYAEQAASIALDSGDEATAAALLHDLVVNADLPIGQVARLAGRIPYEAMTAPPGIGELAGSLTSALAIAPARPDEEADVRIQLSRALWNLGDWEAARAEAERAVRHLAHDPAAAARAMIILGRAQDAPWPASVHLRWLHQASELTARMTTTEGLGLTVDRITGLLRLGEEQAWAEAAQVPEEAQDPQPRRHIARAHLNFGDMAMKWGRYAEARRRLERALELAEAHAYLGYRDAARASLAHLDWFTGAWDGLIEWAGSLTADEDVDSFARDEAALVVALLNAANRTAEAEGQLRRALEQRNYYSIEAAAALARLWLADGKIRDAVAVTEAAVGQVAAKGTWIWATDIAPARIAALAATGRTEEAAELVRAFGRGLRGRDAPGPQAGLALCRAVLAEARGENDRAARLGARAAAAWLAVPRPYDALLARERQAGCLLATAQRRAGLATLAGIFSELSELGARGDAARVARTLREHGVNARPPRHGARRGYGNQLSPRELDVARLLVHGKTNREIAAELFLSPKTVARHVDASMRKLGVSSRTALAVKVTEAGLAPADPANRHAR